MKVAHFSPFAPRACGLYEAARDFVLADRAAGRESIFVDLGKLDGDKYIPPRPAGLEDKRRTGTLVTSSYDDARDADLFVAHSCLPADFLTSTQQPVLFVLHGRPVDCVRPEFYRRGNNAYSIYHDVASWPRVRRLLTLWPEQVPFWEPIVPAGKLAVIASPPVDQQLYCPVGPAHEFDPGTKGDFNVLVADSWREDDPYYIVHGAMQAAARIPGLRLHIYSAEKQKPDPSNLAAACNSGPWEPIYAHLKSLGILGEVCGRMPDMDQVYRAMDCVLTHNPSASRIVAEAISCGVPVVAAQPNPFTPFAYVAQHDVPGVAAALVAVHSELQEHGRGLDGMLAETAEAFAPALFAERIGKVYEETLGSKES